MIITPLPNSGAQIPVVRRLRPGLPLLRWALPFLFLGNVFSAPEPLEEWQVALLRELCGKYLARPETELVHEEEYHRLLDELAVAVGGKLSASGTSQVPAQDLAALALLLSYQAPSHSSITLAQSIGESPPPQQASIEQAQTPAERQVHHDVRKGNEGFRQAVEKFSELPISERMVITGDITAGFQAATVRRVPDLTSAFGRARLNFVARAVPASASGRVGDGYFFMQMRAAGGPFDTNAVGGPRSFSPINDVATDRSRFNEGTSRGNLYLSKIFFQQELQLGEDRVLARFGVIDLSDYFDTNAFANNEARQFINGALVNSAAFKFGISAPGFMAEYDRKIDRDWLRRAVFKVGYGISRTERAFTSPIWTGEAEFQTFLKGRRGAWRFGWTLGNVPDLGSVRGFHMSFDQWISQNKGLFGRYAVANGGLGSLSFGLADQSFSGGFQWRFVDAQERVSEWSVGFSQASGIRLDEPMSSERVLETFYRFQLTEQFSFTPDFQLILGSGGRTEGGFHTVLGMRMNFAF